jgi:Flp pilus assembly protein TadD
MIRTPRFAPTLTAIALASVIAGCASPQSKVLTSFGGKQGKPQIGMAMRALAALNADDYAGAVNFGERAVQNSPNDAGFRSLLGNAYFASGRFASAETAYSEALSLYPNQPQTVLKLALVQIAQGKNTQALSFLAQARNTLEAADFGLALALAGQPQEAVNVLSDAARQAGADARVRQNLALAHGLAGDWMAARNVAEQDLSPDLVDARIQQWMTFAKPVAAYDQVAALTGFKPTAVDPGQPTRLALRNTDTRTAQVEQPAPVFITPPQEPQQPVVQYVPDAPPVVAQGSVPPFADSVPAAAPVVAEARVVAEAPVPQPRGASKFIAAAAEAVADAVVEAPAAVADMVYNPKPRNKASSVRVKLRPASMPRATGEATAVVQLGAYGSSARVAKAWHEAARRYSALRAYSPVSARFNSSRGLVYRLSVKGFGNAEQAKNLCQSLRRSGGQCFVRSVAGDAPVHLASR